MCQSQLSAMTSHCLKWQKPSFTRLYLVWALNIIFLVHVPLDNMDEVTYNAAGHQGVIKTLWLHTHTHRHLQFEARHDQTGMISVLWRYTAGRNTGRTPRPCGQRPNPLITSSQFILRCPSPQENGRCIRCVTCQKIYWFHTRRAVPVFCSLLVFCGSCSFLSLSRFYFTKWLIFS